MSKAPYVISADIETLGGEYVRQENLDAFRTDLTEDLTAMGKSVEWVRYADLKAGIDTLIARTSLDVISLDDRYVHSAPASFGISRAVNYDLDDAGYDARIGYPSVESQFNVVGSQLSGKEAVIVDDVIFSGDNACWVIDELAKRKVHVRAVISGIAIGEASAKLASREVELLSVRSFEDVDDEICERDFAFVRGSGRKIHGSNMSALYFDSQFGRPVTWASIDAEHAAAFCTSSIRRNMDLLREQVPMHQIGNFFGYDCSANVGVCLAGALEQRLPSVA